MSDALVMFVFGAWATFSAVGLALLVISKPTAIFVAVNAPLGGEYSEAYG